MHKILFENKLSTLSTFSPFGSNKNSKPGIITKIKNKIQDLFQPSINPSNTIQPIQYYNDQNQDKELSYQFQNKLVIVDHFIPNKEHIPTSKRKGLYPFDLYIKELDQNQNQISDKAIVNKPMQPNDQEPILTNTKEQMKFQKNHAKIEKSNKMEVNLQNRDFKFNKKSQNLNVELKQKNSIGSLANHSIKKIKYNDNSIETVSPSQQQEGQTNGQMSQINQFEIQSFAIIKQNQQIGCQQLSDQKNKISETQNRHSCNIVNFKQFIQENQCFSNSTGTNTQGETQETIFNIEHISSSQQTDSSISEKKYSIDNSLEIQDKHYSIFHPDIVKKSNLQVNKELQQNRSPDEHKNNIIMDQNQISQNRSESPMQIKKQRNLIFDSKIINLSIQCNLQNKNENKNEIQKLQSEIQFKQEDFKCKQNQVNTIKEDSCEDNKDQNVFLSDPIQKLESNQNRSILEQNKDSIQQQSQNEQIFQKELLQKQQDEKLDSSFSQNALLSMNCESTTRNSKIIQENYKSKEFNMKTNQILQQNNPFLDTSSHISSDQVSQYFSQGLITENTQNFYQQQQITQNQNPIDLFKMQTNNQLFNFNVLVQNQSYQDQDQYQYQYQNLYAQQQLNQKNDQYLIYQQMEIIDQIPLSDQFNFTQNNNYQQPIQNYYSPNYEQKYYCQPGAFQQCQSSFPWIGYQSQNPYPQMQQSSFQISSINLFQSNPSMVNSNPNCCQEENTINHIYTKQDVLSFFQDTNKKQDQNIFAFDSIQSNNTQAQNQNNTFTRGYRKKQRINNN